MKIVDLDIIKMCVESGNSTIIGFQSCDAYENMFKRNNLNYAKISWNEAVNPVSFYKGCMKALDLPLDSKKMANVNLDSISEIVTENIDASKYLYLCVDISGHVETIHSVSIIKFLMMWDEISTFCTKNEIVSLMILEWGDIQQ